MKNVDYNVRAQNAIEPANQVGKISKTFGNEGQLVIKLWDNFPQNINSEPLWVSIDSLAVPLFIASFENQGASKAVVTFDDFLSVQLASMLVGLNLYAENTQAEQNNTPQNSMVGRKFHDLTSDFTGTITDFFDDPYNPLLELTSETLSEPALVPYNENFITRFDKRKDLVTFELPLGIFDL